MGHRYVNKGDRTSYLYPATTQIATKSSQPSQLNRDGKDAAVSGLLGVPNTV